MGELFVVRYYNESPPHLGGARLTWVELSDQYVIVIVVVIVLAVILELVARLARTIPPLRPISQVIEQTPFFWGHIL